MTVFLSLSFSFYAQKYFLAVWGTHTHRIHTDHIINCCQFVRRLNMHTLKLSELFTQTRAQNESDSRTNVLTMIFKKLQKKMKQQQKNIINIETYDLQNTSECVPVSGCVCVRPKRFIRSVTLKNHKMNQNAFYICCVKRCMVSIG